MSKNVVSINKSAMAIVRRALEDRENLGIIVHQMKCGATVIDMGVHCSGSWKAGLLFGMITLGGQALVSLGEFILGEYILVSADVYIDNPLIACLSSQISGWKLGEGEFATIGSGPARAVAAVAYRLDNHLEDITKITTGFDSEQVVTVIEGDPSLRVTPYKDTSDEVVLCIQDIKLPGEQIGEMVAEACGVEPSNVYLLVAPSASMVGTIQIATRSVEQVCHKMYKKGFDLKQIICARGKAPIAPLARNEVKAMGRLNDSLLYGATAEFWVDTEDEQIERIINQLVSKHSSPEYGTLFAEIFERANRDFYQIHDDVNSLAKVQIHNVRSGKAFLAGEIRYDLLKRSFFTNECSEGQ